MRRLVLAALLLTGGCAYFNGMYNTKRQAAAARRAEREGRTFEANQFWNVVAVKAESVLIRHPTSKWVDEARLLRGTALARLRDCARAVVPLEQVLTTSRNPRLQEDAAAELGDCRLQQGDSRGAMAAYSRLLASRDKSRRDRALYEHGRALRLAGDPEAALAELSRTGHRHAAGERAAALAALGRVDEVDRLTDSLFAAADTAAPWSDLLASLAQVDSARARAVLDRLAAWEDTPPAFRGALLIEDGKRLDRIDPARAEARYLQVEQIGADLPIGGLAHITRLRGMLARSRSTVELADIESDLSTMAETPGPHAPAALLLEGVVRRTRLAADSALPGTDRGDLRLFVAGELARDSLAAPLLSAALFARLAEEWPDSPFTPKALLNVLLLAPDRGDSVRAVLTGRYGASPYVAVLQEGPSEEFTALEDSLRRFAATFRPEGRTSGRKPGQPASNQPRRPLD
jgi:hypothetical protein